MLSTLCPALVALLPCEAWHFSVPDLVKSSARHSPGAVVAAIECVLASIWLSYHMQAQPQAVFCLRSAASAAQQRDDSKDHKGSVQVQQQEFDAITDQIPLRPVGAVEATSYTFLILAGLGLAGWCSLTFSVSGRLNKAAIAELFLVGWHWCFQLSAAVRAEQVHSVNYGHLPCLGTFQLPACIQRHRWV